MNIKKSTKVLLTYEMEGRLGTTVSNANSKEEIYKMLISPMEQQVKGGKWISPKHRYVAQNNFKERPKQTCIHKQVLSEECVQYAISDDGFVHGFNKKTWKKLSIKNRLEEHLKLIADGNPYVYELLD